MNRRGFITGLISFAATAPAIVRVASLMPVKAISIDDLLHARMNEAYAVMRDNLNRSLYGDNLITITRKAFVPRMAVQIYKQTAFLTVLQQMREEDARSLN